MQFRHEVKHEISNADMIILRQRLRAVMKPDIHAVDGKYLIRSLYFDTPDDKALREKMNGVRIREKYRIRLYDNDPSTVHLERKYKQGGIGFKESASLTPEQVQAIISGDTDWMAESESELVRSFSKKIYHEGLSPKVIVDYIREPFVFGPGNVRVTLDHDIRTALKCVDVLDPDIVTVPIPNSPNVLEVKWDSFLPDVIRDAVQLGDRHNTAFSKYAMSRVYE